MPTWNNKLLVLAAVVVLGVVLGASFSRQPAQKSLSPRGVVVKTEFSEGISRLVVALVEETLRREFLPRELRFQKVNQSSESVEYSAEWQSGTDRLNILAVTTPDAATLRYIRIWLLPAPAVDLNPSTAGAMLERVFTARAISQAGALDCKDSENSSGQGRFTICAGMKTVSSGDKYGALVRSALPLPGGTQAAVVSFCEVPKESPAFREITWCL